MIIINVAQFVEKQTNHNKEYMEQFSSFPILGDPGGVSQVAGIFVGKSLL